MSSFSGRTEEPADETIDLEAAMVNGRLEVARWLVDVAGCDIDGESGTTNGATDGLAANGARGSDTPLMLAAHCGHLELVEALLRAGAQLRLRDAQGRTARDVAAAEGHGVVASHLAAREQHEQREGVFAQQEETVQELARLHGEYVDKFGFAFLTCTARGKSADQMLAALKARLPNDPELELKVAAAEQARTAYYSCVPGPCMAH